MCEYVTMLVLLLFGVLDLLYFTLRTCYGALQIVVLLLLFITLKHVYRYGCDL